ncbi:MAG: dicarboxylate/amino acid:cation symporter, partial [Proteobacteria bacterium]|nr:dicarboxylate/amino acid:cation symporter [Pseudomonadota bacterium]
MHTIDTTPTAPSKGLALHYKVLIGFVLGTGLGLAGHALALDAAWIHGLIEYATKPFGQIFLNLLFMLVVPLIFSALVLGVAELGDIAALGRLGWKTLIYTAVVTAAAVGIGLLCVNLLQPGLHMDPALVQKTLSSNVLKAGEIVSKGNDLRLMDLLVNIVPHNIVGAMGDDKQKLGIVFFALMIGIGLVM